MMRKLIPAFVLISTVTVVAEAQILDKLPPAECQPDDERIQVLLLASYHMANPGADQFNLQSDDVLSLRRKAEIEQLVKQLSEFKPTKIAIEAPYGSSATKENYQQYVNGTRELSRSESEQIGFRLAKQMNHQEIYAIDVPSGMDDSKLKPLVGANPKFQAQMGELQKLGGDAVALMQKWLETNSVSGMLYQMNRPEILAQAHVPYVDFFVPIADGDNYAGADMVAEWYKRNLRIFANLNRISEPGDRVVIIYGMGHVPILRQLVTDSQRFCHVDPLPYLEKSTPASVLVK